MINSISNTSTKSAYEIANEKAQIEALKATRNEEKSSENTVESTDVRAANSFDTVTISEEGYAAVSNAVHMNNSASETDKSSSVTQGASAASGSGETTTQAAVVESSSDLTVEEQQYDKDDDGELSTTEKKAMQADLENNEMQTDLDKTTGAE